MLNYHFSNTTTTISLEVKMVAERALIVDSELKNIKKLSHSLKKMGFWVEGESNSHAAMEKIHNGNGDFDMIFIEQRMPTISGIDILRDIQASNCKSCVIFMTETPDLNTIVSVMQEGAFSFLKKPIDYRQLKDIIRKGLENRRALFHILEMDDKLKQSNSKLKKQSEKLKKEKRSLKEINQELHLLNQLSLQINSTLDAHRMLDKVAHSKFNELIAHDIVTFVYFLGEDVFFKIYSPNLSLSSTVVEKLKSDSIKEYTLSSGKKLHSSTIHTKVIKRKTLRNTTAKQSPSAHDKQIFIPLKVANNVLGMMGLVGIHKLTRNHHKLISTMANQIALSLKNLTEHQRIQELAITDELTGLHNRRSFQKALDRELRRSKRYQKPLSLIMLDVDGFKGINDTFGHQEGDTVLKFLAVYLQGAVRDIDFVARYGGDEFAVILPETKAKEAAILAERLKRMIKNCPITIGGSHHTITLSAGVTDISNEIIDNERTLVNRADKVLYLSKEQGGDSVEVLCNRQ
jgi:diguanylate cyclase (GGDEF)-like protein